MDIKKAENAYFHPTIKRLVQISEHAKQITLQDQRYYQRDLGVFYPSVTHVLSYFPKSKFFESWTRDVGHNIDIILRKAGEEGTMVHQAIDTILRGGEVVWLEESGHVNYPTDVWRMIVKFADFWEKHKPVLIASECHLFSDEHKFAGTGDIICEIKGDIWLIDTKSSNALHKSFELQTAAYAVAWNETHNVKIDKRGILWLKSKTRGENKVGNLIQGDGWILKESSKSLEEDFELFKLAYRLFELENGEKVPMTEILPTVIKLRN